ncbi:MAG: domain S-box protein [Hydrocarboniphaga sp.]|uniref:PAS domain S-box protein n=1 Tax=Hydrocarboniphaga sp. TaxID=2033016 RepID=UPI002608F7D2|nr:PAS domain S-box protein [Hydrocarboniphaga sp.]MDB5971215.1 domain S-box protein [Hydrocarboniphaga sp.]
MPGRLLVAIVDLGGGIRLLNEHCEQAIGLSPALAQGRLVWETLAAPEQADKMRAAFASAAAGAAVPDQQGHWQAADGTRFGVHWGYSALRDADGKPQQVVITGSDLRVTRSIQAELIEALDRQQAILDTAVDGIITIGESGDIQSFNRAAERIFGYRAGEVIGRNVSMLMPAPYRAEHDGYLNNYLSTHRKKVIGIGREVRGLRKDGTQFPLELSVGEVVTSGERVFTGIIRDSTDRNLMEIESRRRQDELAHLSRIHSMGDLAAGLAHEITQPLTAILSTASACIRMVDSATADAELLRESMSQIAQQADRAAEVIRRLRRYVRRGEVESELHDIASCVDEAIELLQHDLKVHGLRVTVTAPPALPRLLLDRIQIEQVLINLIRNAIQAWVAVPDLAPVLEVEIGTTTAPAGVSLSVADNGPGLGPDAEQVFAAFFTTKPEGLGQGLSICRRILESHGGSIQARNREGRGAVFTLWLPLP